MPAIVVPMVEPTKADRVGIKLVNFGAVVVGFIMFFQGILLLRLTQGDNEERQFRRDVRALILCGRDPQCTAAIIENLRKREGIVVNNPTVTSVVVVPGGTSVVPVPVPFPPSSITTTTRGTTPAIVSTPTTRVGSTTTTAQRQSTTSSSTTSSSSTSTTQPPITLTIPTIKVGGPS